MACRIPVHGVPRFSRYGEHNRLGLTPAGPLVGQVTGSFRLALANGGGDRQSSEWYHIEVAVEFAE